MGTLLSPKWLEADRKHLIELPANPSLSDESQKLPRMTDHGLTWLFQTCLKSVVCLGISCLIRRESEGVQQLNQFGIMPFHLDRSSILYGPEGENWRTSLCLSMRPICESVTSCTLIYRFDFRHIPQILNRSLLLKLHKRWK